MCKVCSTVAQTFSHCDHCPEAPNSGAGKLQLTDQIWLVTCFFKIKFYWKTAMLIHL